MASQEGSALAGRRVVVTAGGTREAIDPVRFLGNRSSGRMGNALATEAANRGALVTLVSTVPGPENVRVHVVAVESAEDMHHEVRRALPGAALLVMAAAVADYRVAAVAPQKLRKSARMTLDLIPTVDILASLAGDPARQGVLVVGFAAETHDLEENARRKLEEKGLDLIVLNDVSRSDVGMGSSHNEVTVLASTGVVARVPRRPKSEVATAILDVVETHLREGPAVAGDRVPTS